jgi:cytochrome c556
MKRICVLASVISGLAGGALFAQGDNDYQIWMKAVAASNGTLQKGIAAKDKGAVVADAQKLQDTFKQVGDFWQKRGAADAVNFAKQAETAAGAVAKSAANGDMDQASADAKTLGATCGGCHMAHREKTDAGFKIK